MYKARYVRQKVYKNNSEIFCAGGYVTESGKEVEIAINDPMLDGTKVYSEAFDVNHIVARSTETTRSTVNNDCLAVAKRLLDEGLNPCVMNLADAYTACGFYKRRLSAEQLPFRARYSNSSSQRVARLIAMPRRRISHSRSSPTLWT